MADSQPFNPEDLIASVAASMPPGPQTSPVQQDQGNNPVGQMSPMSQVVNPNPAQPQQPKPQGPPTPRPILFDLMRAIKPEQQAPQVGAFGALGPQRTGNRLEHFESFLGNFLNAFATGMGAAHGPGAFGKGMSAAAAAPWQRSVEQYQLGQQGQVQQAQAQNLAAEAQLRQAQAAPVQVPGIQGSIPAGSVPTIYRGYPAAQVAAGAKLDAVRLQMQYAQMKGSKYIPDVDPQTGQMMYRVMNPFGQQIGTTDVDAIRQFMGRSTSTIDWKQGPDGSWQALPKTTTATPTTPKVLGQSSTVKGQVATGSNPSGFPSPKQTGTGRFQSPSSADVGVAYDPKTNGYVQTTRKDAFSTGLQQFQKITPKESEDNRQLNNRLTDVATKISRYEQSLSTPLSPGDQGRMAGLLATDKFKVGLFGTDISVDRVNQLLDSENAKGLSRQAKQRILAYANARESMIGYQRVLAGSARNNDKQLELNLAAMPSPVMPDDYTREGISQFKENLKIAAQGLPKMPGISGIDEAFAKFGSKVPQPAQSNDTVNSLIKKYGGRP